MRKTRVLVLISMLSSLLVVSQVALAFLPNVELVTLLFFIYTRRFGLWITLATTFIFSSVMALIWGFGTWVIMYYLIWPLLVIMMFVFMKYLTNVDRISLFLGFLGLIFGLLFSLEPLLYQSLNMAIAYFIRGIPFDIIHGASNYIVALLLFEKLDIAALKLREFYH